MATVCKGLVVGFGSKGRPGRMTDAKKHTGSDRVKGEVILNLTVIIYIVCLCCWEYTRTLDCLGVGTIHSKG